MRLLHAILVVGLVGGAIALRPVVSVHAAATTSLASPATLAQPYLVYLPLNANASDGSVLPGETDKNQSQPTPTPTPTPTPETDPEPEPEPTSTPEPAAECELNAQEQAVAERMQTHTDQGRAQLVCDPILAQVARERAADMATRGYFGHVNPDGVGPNYLVRAVGYVLPTWYSQDRAANNLESIGAGYPSAQAVWDGWMASPGHRRHVLATENGDTVEFYAAQEAYGIGYWQAPDSPYRHYWVVITAPIAPGN